MPSPAGARVGAFCGPFFPWLESRLLTLRERADGSAEIVGLRSLRCGKQVCHVGVHSRLGGELG
jgi:hypothetical protein